MRGSLLFYLCLLCFFTGAFLKSTRYLPLPLFVASWSLRPLVARRKSAHRYTTVLSVDGGGFRLLSSTFVLIEIENAIKRYLLDHPEHLPDADFTSIEDFDILLADYFDAMSGVSAGAWVTGYLSSKGGNGVAAKVLNRRAIVRRYGAIIPGGARGLEVFFREFGPSFYPGGINVAVEPPTVTPSMLRRSRQGSRRGMNPTGGVTSFSNLLPHIQIPGINGAFYPVEDLEAALELFLGDVKMSELSTYFFVPAYDLIRRQLIRFIHDTTPKKKSKTFAAHPLVLNKPRQLPNGSVSYQPDFNFEELDFLVRDIARGSSALPAFHESKVLSPVGMDDVTYALVDGALISNNPALQTLTLLSSAPRRIPIKDIAMISLGSGAVLLDLESNENNAALGWLLNAELLTILFDGSSEDVAHQVDFLFYGNPKVKANQYLRIQTFRERNTTEGEAIASATNEDEFPVFTRIGKKVAKQFRASIDNFVEEFIFA